MMETFILYWLDGTLETVTGTSIANAFNRAGYETGAINALNFYEKSETGVPAYEYNAIEKKWENIK